MSYELTLHIREDSPQEKNIESLAEAAHVTREEAALRLLATSHATSHQAPTSAPNRYAAVKAVTGSLKGNDWILHDFNEEKRDKIEQENQRDIL